MTRLIRPAFTLGLFAFIALPFALATPSAETMRVPTETPTMPPPAAAHMRHSFRHPGRFRPHPSLGLQIARRVNRYAYALDLSNDQAAKIAVWRNETLRRVIPLMQAMRKSRLRLRHLLLTGASASQVSLVVRRLDQAYSRLLRINIATVQKFRTLLNPQQWRQVTKGLEPHNRDREPFDGRSH